MRDQIQNKWEIKFKTNQIQNNCEIKFKIKHKTKSRCICGWPLTLFCSFFVSISWFLLLCLQGLLLYLSPQLLIQVESSSCDHDETSNDEIISAFFWIQFRRATTSDLQLKPMFKPRNIQQSLCLLAFISTYYITVSKIQPAISLWVIKLKTSNTPSSHILKQACMPQSYASLKLRPTESHFHN